MSNPARRIARRATRWTAKHGSVFVIAALLGATLGSAAHADRVVTLDDGELIGRVTVQPDTNAATVTPDDGPPRTIALQDLDRVTFGEVIKYRSSDVLVVDHADPLFGNKVKTNKIKLRAGLHRFVLPYWQNENQRTLSVTVTGPGIGANVNLHDGHIRCFRATPDAYEQSPGFDENGYRLPEYTLRQGDNPRVVQKRARYRLLVGGEQDAFNGIGVLDRLDVKLSGTTSTIDTQFINDPTTRFGLVFEGFFVAPEDGEFAFTLRSDDGAQLYLGERSRFGSGAVDNTRVHAPWHISLRSDGIIRGQLKAITNDKLLVHIPLVSDAELTLGQAVILRDASIDAQAIDSSKAQPGLDTVFVRDKDEPTKLVTLAGKVLSLDDDSLNFFFRGKQRSLTRDRIAGIVLGHADRDAPPDPGPYQLLALRGGQQLPARLLELDDRVRFELIGGGVLMPPRDTLLTMTSENGRRVDLTQVTPSAEEAIPYFSLKLPYRVNRTYADEPIRLFDGETYDRGLVVHSKSRLHYKLDRPAQRFEARLGLLSPNGRLGNITARVIGDGAVLWEQDDITAESQALDINVPITGVKRLILEVDYGQGQHVGDRAAWCNPKIIYEPEK